MHTYSATPCGAHEAAELIFTGKPISAVEVKTAGLTTRVVPADTLNDETMTLAKEVASSVTCRFENCREYYMHVKICCRRRADRP